jgi:tetratricopeptide (TPR) repeat protein
MVGLLADAGRRRLTEWVLGTDQERALRQAATAAVQLTAQELSPHDGERAAELAMVVSHVFQDAVPEAGLGGQPTLLEILLAGVARQLAPLDDQSLTGAGESSAQLLGVPAMVLAGKLAGHLEQEIAARGARGGPLAPLADQLNHDKTHLQLGRLAATVTALEQSMRAAYAWPVSARVVEASLAQLPRSVTGFTGRVAELAMLAGMLDPAGASGPVLPCAVAGLAGVGKTSLAVEAGHAALRNGWFGRALFIDLHGYDEVPVEPRQALDVLLRALQVPAEHIPSGVAERAELYQSVLAQANAPVLVIADNAAAEAQVRALQPVAGPHRVLTTSRHTLAGLEARLLDLGVLDEAAGVALLGKALRIARPADDRISGDPAAAGSLARMCGGLPLALQITAALLKADPALTAAELAGELAAESGRLEQLAYDDGSGAAAPSVVAAFDLSYRRLEESQARVFRLLPTAPGPDVSTAAAAILVGLPAGAARKVLSVLARAHLIESAPAAVGRWQMHDLLRLYAGRLADTHGGADGREQARDRLLDYYLGMARAADEHVRALPGVAVSDEFASRAAALDWFDAERASLVAAVDMAAASGRDRMALALPGFLAEYLLWRRRFDGFLAITTVGLSAARRLGDRHAEGMALDNQGLALRLTQRIEDAIAAHRDAAGIFRETGDRHAEAMASDNLGNALGIAAKETGQLEQAISAHRDAAEIFRETGDLQAEARAISNLSTVLLVASRLDEAIGAINAAGAIFLAIGDRHGEAQVLSIVGNILQKGGRHAEAVTADEAAAAIYRETGDRHGEATALTGVGLALQQGQRYAEAAAAHQTVAAVNREIGDRHGEGMAVNCAGEALSGLGRFAEAVDAHREAVAILREFGDADDTGIALDNLGMALREAGQPADAVTVHREAAAVFRRTGDRTAEGRALDNLGLAIQKTGRSAEAAIAFRDAATTFREAGDRPAESASLSNLGLALTEAGEAAAAISILEDAVAICQQTCDRPTEGAALNNLGLALDSAGRSREAVTAHRRAAEIFDDTGNRHGEAGALDNLGCALRKIGHFGDAVTAHQRATEIFRETGDRHGEGAALSNLGEVSRQMRRTEQTIAAFGEAAAAFRDAGDRHLEGIMLNNLGSALHGAGRFAQAISAHREAATIFRQVPDQRQEGMALNNLGVALLESGQAAEAVTACRDAVALFSRARDRSGERTATANLRRAQAAQRA